MAHTPFHFTNLPISTGNTSNPNLNIPNDLLTLTGGFQDTNVGSSNNLLPDISINNQSRPPQQTPGLFNRGSNLIPGLQVFSNLANAYTGLKQIDLSKEAFDFNKKLTKTNLANQAKVTNAAIADRARASAVQRGAEGDELDQIINRQLNERRIRGTL
jgi:hypothetical protein